MPKVLRIINRFNLGGPTYNVTFLTKYMSDEYETLLIGGIPDKGESDSHHILEQYDISPTIIPELERDINLKNDRAALKKIRSIIKEFKPDIVHTHASKAGALGRYAALKENVPIILHTFHGHVFHSYFGKTKTVFYKTIERRLAKKTSGIIAISPQQKKELIEQHKITTPEKCYVIRLGFDLEKFEKNTVELRESMRARYNIEDETICIGIIGRLAPIKDHFFFLNAIDQLINETSKKIKVFIIGDGVLKETIEQHARSIEQKNGIQNIFVFTSWVQELENIIHGLDIVALSSKNEGTPVSIIEGMASKKAVISTNVGGVKDLIENGVSGYYSEVNDEAQYVANLKELAENDQLRKNMGEKGHHFAIRNYHYTRLVKDMENLYSDLLNRLN